MRISDVTILLRSSRQEQAVVAEKRLRAPLPVVRRVGFASLRGGTGCTTVATRIAQIYATRRGGRALLIDATQAELRSTPPDVPHFSITDAVWPGGVSAWQEQVGRAQRSHELSLTDWGALGENDLLEVAAHSHVFCLTTTMELAAAQEALSIAETVANSGTHTLLVASAVRGRPRFAQRHMLASSARKFWTVPPIAAAGTAGASADFALALLAAEIVRLAGSSSRQRVNP